MKLSYTTPAKLIGANYNPSIRTGKNELKKLMESIKKYGILNPVLIDDKSNIIDGHRRIACAKALKISAVPVITVDAKLKKDKYYEQINTTSRKMLPNEMIYIFINGGNVPESATKKIERLQTVLGAVNLKKLANKFVSVSVLTRGNKIGKYCGDPSNEFLRNCIMWIVNNKQSYQVRKALEDSIPVATLKTAIKENRPLKRNWK